MLRKFNKQVFYLPELLVSVLLTVVITEQSQEPTEQRWVRTKGTCMCSGPGAGMTEACWNEGNRAWAFLY
ncbi:hypothetical protein DPEC_G00139910 [Dallia pectoralis]|uniref:Uncharacterized protein n=1 Tax=Dallia pectoralis TaxID=75939 RepID=A0ACC2GM18_DALPE|nr:hypothetical protein DPEC_G00139910 [Dallia pectoralis]